MMSPNKWEIWLAKVKFEDNPTQVKPRPVLVIDSKRCYIISIKITSHPPRTEYDGEYSIVKWSEAGLNKASTIRCSKRLKLFNSDFVHKLGWLHPIDIISIQKIIENL